MQASGPAETPAERATRYSRFSAGQGGPLFAFTEVIAGLITGGYLGGAINDRDGAFLGALTGGFGLGTAAIVYQYYRPVGLMESFLIAGGATSGFMAGIGLARVAEMNERGQALSTFLLTQAGVAATLLATLGEGDVSAGDSALVGMTGLYSLVVTSLVMAIHDASGSNRSNYNPVLFAPAAGMLVGGLLANAFELQPTRIFKLTVLPMGVGIAMLYLSALAESPEVRPAATLGAIAATFVLTALFTSDPPEGTSPAARADSGIRAMPTPVVMSAGRRGESLAAGPGIFVQF